MIYGKDLKIFADGVAVAAAKSCEISMSVDTHEVATPSDVDWRRFKADRSEWTVSVSTLVTEFYTRFNLGQKVTLTMAVCNANGMTDDRLIGTAWLQKSEITAQLGNLVQGSFSFQGVGVLGPLYDAEIEYLESTGTQYIDTGIKLTSGTTEIKLVFNAAITEFTTTTRMIAHSTPNSGIQVYSGYAAAQNRIFNQGASLTATADTFYTITTTTTASQRTIQLNSGTPATQSFSRSITDDSTLNICGFPDWVSTSQNSKAKYKSFKIYVNNTLVRDYISVRKNQVGYFYDRVSDTLFGNNGTGNFTLGPDKT